jgi:hypothetical protein
LNGGCGVVCCVATPSNARGRHSQVLNSGKNQRALPFTHKKLIFNDNWHDNCFDFA